MSSTTGGQGCGFQCDWYDSWGEARELPPTHFELFADRKRLADLMKSYEHKDELPEVSRVVMDIFL